MATINSELRSKIHNLMLGIEAMHEAWYVMLVEFIKLVLNIVYDLMKKKQTDFDAKALEDFFVKEYMEFLNISIIPDFFEEKIIRLIVHELIALVIGWFKKK